MPEEIKLKPCPFCGDSGFSIFKEGSPEGR